MKHPSEYCLVDTGRGLKLEKLGDHLVVRPAFNAVWSPALPAAAWKKADAVFHGEMEGGNGKWVSPGIHGPFQMRSDGRRFECRLSDYGHTGLFMEQSENWRWLESQARPGGRYLNLFAYTGGSTLPLLQHGRVTHLDASRSVVSWAKSNAALNGLTGKPSRWIVDDAMRFAAREKKRGQIYDGIVLDPPTFGRGGKGLVWKIEKDLLPILTLCRELLAKTPHLFLLTAHTHGLTHHVLKNCLLEIFPESHIESGDMNLVDQAGRVLPSGTFARFTGKSGMQ